MSKAKASAAVWAVWIILTILIAGGLVYYYQFTKIPAINEEISNLKDQVADLQEQMAAKEEETDETADWETYSNETYKFSIKYPKDWFIDTTNSEKDYTPRGEDRQMIGGDTTWENKNEFDCTPATCSSDLQTIILMVHKVDSSSTISDFAKDFSGVQKTESFSTKSGIEGKKYLYSNIESSSKTIVGESIMFKKDNMIFSFAYSNSKGLDSSTTGIFENMISTFQFTD